MRRLFLALLLPAVMPAQNTSSALSGTVQDAAGAVILNIKVVLTGEENGFVRTATTTHEGFFSFPDMTPASFTISISAPGFKTYRQTGILVNADEQRSLGRIRLEVGQLSDSVTVTAEAIVVNTATGERAGTLTGEQLDQIPLRRPDLFHALTPIPAPL